MGMMKLDSRMGAAESEDQKLRIQKILLSPILLSKL